MIGARIRSPFRTLTDSPNRSFAYNLSIPDFLKNLVSTRGGMKYETSV